MKGHLVKLVAVAAALLYVAAGLTLAGRIWWRAGVAAGVASLLVWVWMSYYALGVVAAFLRFRYIARWEAWQRYTQGLCVQCGYDLRASHVRCPECGRAAPEKYRP